MRVRARSHGMQSAVFGGGGNLFIRKKAMGTLTSVSEKKRRNPIKRNNKFFSGEDFELEMDFGREYVEEDANQSVILYEVDLEQTKVDDIYHEATKDAIRFKTPVEIPVVYQIDQAELKAYRSSQSKGFYSKTGKLTFGVYEQTLVDYGCDIKRGDYIGVQITPEHIEYFTVADDGRVNFDNAHTMFGTRPFYRTVVCSPVDNNEFQG